jgi:hypothetical protein
VYTSWLVMCTLDALAKNFITTSSPMQMSSCIHPALKSAFEAAYPPRHPDHHSLPTIDFVEFFYAIGDETYAKLMLKIDAKTNELVWADTFSAHWIAAAGIMALQAGSAEDQNEDPATSNEVDKILANTAYMSAYRLAQGLNVLRWLFEERQDILAGFVQGLCVDMKTRGPCIVRVRGRRE